MRSTTKHIKSEMRGPGAALHIVEHDADDLDSDWEATHEVGWYSLDVIARIRQSLHEVLSSHTKPLSPRDIERLRLFIQQVKDKHARIGQLHLGEEVTETTDEDG